jgi:hypothetical protein
MSGAEQPKSSRAKAIGVGVVFASVILIAWFLFLLTPPVSNPTTAPKNECINNLRLIDGAKQEWALEHHKAAADVPTWPDLFPYLSRYPYDTNMLKCPSRGTYTLGAVSNKPTCSIPGHALP